LDILNIFSINVKIILLLLNIEYLNVANFNIDSTVAFHFSIYLCIKLIKCLKNSQKMTISKNNIRKNNTGIVTDLMLKKIISKKYSTVSQKLIKRNLEINLEIAIFIYIKKLYLHIDKQKINKKGSYLQDTKNEWYNN
ncbi:hypothetical protein BpHYR1_022605, partial [Brachionus plicatilis]